MSNDIPPDFIRQTTTLSNNTPLIESHQVKKLKSIKFPVLILPKHDIHLRQQSKDDAEHFLAYYAYPDVNQYILADIPQNLQQATIELEYCRSLFYIARGLHWAIAKNNNNEMIGAIGIYLQDTPNVCEICYELNKDYWNQGIMSAAMNTVIRYLHTTLKIQRIEALTLKENSASGHLLEKNGFQFDKTLSQHRLFKGKKHDVERYVWKEPS